MSTENKLGITNLTEAGVATARLLRSYTAAAADGTISLWEWLRIGIGDASHGGGSGIFAALGKGRKGANSTDIQIKP